MPSKKSNNKSASRRSRRSSKTALVLYPLLIFTFIIWFLYRSLFEFPVWFDEIIGKSIFFGLPVWLYVTITGGRKIIDSLDFGKMNSGLLLGLALGGLYGFTASLASLIGRGSTIVMVPLFASTLFWWEFFLGLMTGFWETLFFFSFVMTGVLQRHKYWSLLNQVLLTAGIFLIFHIPNIVLRFSGTDILTEIILLFLFAVGQAFVFAKRRNFYTLVISHAIWGMVLLVHV
ncbi:MAG: CPBP family glutamic-type intramembrane protease [Patescibacteria group bacterium]